MSKESANKSTNRFLNLGLLMASLSLSVFAAYFYLNLKTGIKITPKVDSLEKSEPVVTLFPSGKPDQWEKYIDNKYGYSLSYPGLLVRREYTDKGGYLHFVRFEENRYSGEEWGVAVGVSALGLGEETVKIKKEMLNSGGELISEEEIFLWGTEAVKLQFKPKDEKTGEQRVAIVFTHKNKTFSVSTIPEQIDRIMEGFKLLDVTPSATLPK